MEEFKVWLEHNKNFGAKSAMDAASRLKRGQTILGTNEIEDNSVSQLEAAPEFTVLSVSVKSQIRRTVKLYLEFLENERNK